MRTKINQSINLHLIFHAERSGVSPSLTGIQACCSPWGCAADRARVRTEGGPRGGRDVTGVLRSPVSPNSRPQPEKLCTSCATRDRPVLAGGVFITLSKVCFLDGLFSEPFLKFGSDRVAVTLVSSTAILLEWRVARKWLEHGVDNCNWSPVGHCDDCSELLVATGVVERGSSSRCFVESRGRAPPPGVRDSPF